MKTSLVRIGNSHGVRIPKAVIDQCGLKREVDMTVKGDTIVIAPARKPRAGWAEAFKRMAEAGDDALLIPDTLSNEFDDKEWRW
jgi:antitoxin MazE